MFVWTAIISITAFLKTWIDLVSPWWKHPHLSPFPPGSGRRVPLSPPAISAPGRCLPQHPCSHHTALPKVSGICHMLSDLSLSCHIRQNAVIHCWTEHWPQRAFWLPWKDRPASNIFSTFSSQEGLPFSPWQLCFFYLLHEVVRGPGPPSAQHLSDTNLMLTH